MNNIYLDNAATTKTDPEVIEVMNEASKSYGNPSSIHNFGQEARKIVDEARDYAAFYLNCDAMEVIFTSGGSEADNLAIRGVVESVIARDEITKQSVGNTRSPRVARDDNTYKPHVITTMIEHHAVLGTIQDLDNRGIIEASYVMPEKNGIVSLESIKKEIKANTILVSVMLANNEVGTVQPIREIGKEIERLNMLRIKNHEARIKNKADDSLFHIHNSKSAERIYFHCDAVQAGEFFNLSMPYLHVDLLSLSAHKFHGPKGVGLLYVKKGTPLKPQITGGEQEFHKRAGTENVPGIAGFMAAMTLIAKRRAESNISGENEENPPFHFDDTLIKVKKLRDQLESFILENISETYVNGDRENRSPNITNISFKNAEGEAIILNLDLLGIAVSSGSACTSRSLAPSHVLASMGLPAELSHGAIRFSLSSETTEEEIDKVCEILPGIIEKLRQMSPFK